MPNPKELTPEQREAREKFELKYNTPKRREEEYAHIQSLLAKTEQSIQTNKNLNTDQLLSAKDRDYLAFLKKEILTLTKTLGLKPAIDIVGYEADDNDPNRDWRE